MVVALVLNLGGPSLGPRKEIPIIYELNCCLFAVALFVAKQLSRCMHLFIV